MDLFERMSKQVKVGLCGQGADELHAGYPRYRNLKKHLELVKNRLELINYKINKDDVGLHSSWDSEKLIPENHYSSQSIYLDLDISKNPLVFLFH